MGEPDEEGSLFQLALQLGWLNQVGVDADNRRKAVYAFFHPTFQEYFAALAVEDWHFFVPDMSRRNNHSPIKGSKHCRVFEIQWKEVLFIWLGRANVADHDIHTLYKRYSETVIKQSEQARPREKEENNSSYNLHNLEVELAILLEIQRRDKLSKEHRRNIESKIIKLRFKIEILYGQKASYKLTNNRSQLAEAAGFFALGQYPHIQKQATADKVDDFCFSLYQFLEQISHCLIWGRNNILDCPEIPLIFNDSIYKDAFLFIKKHLPDNLMTYEKELIHNYIDYVIEKLPSY